MEFFRDPPDDTPKNSMIAAGRGQEEAERAIR
jgi:hypothetical protein